MTEELFFSRARLRREASVAALLPLLGLKGRGRKDGRISPQTSHALVWSLFADSADRKRDFLFREADDGTLYILSAREPTDHHALFELDVKPYEPDLRAGDRLAFALRANPVVRRRVEGRKHSVKDDVVMRALYKNGNERPRHELRPDLIGQEGAAWLRRQADRNGFELMDEGLAVDGYLHHRLPRGGGGRPIRFSTLDFEGVLRVTEPETFLAAVAAGLGHARSFGCGLMLLRRSRGVP